MKICQTCGKQVKDNAKFCSKCGSKLSHENQNVKICRICGKQVKADAKFCTKCGSKLSGENQSPVNEVNIEMQKGDERFRENIKWKKAIKCIGIILILVIVIFSCTERKKEEAQKEQRKYVKESAESFVDELLISPSTADYTEEKIIDKDKYGRYLVYLQVDSQNNFGAMVRSEWCVIVYDVTEDEFKRDKSLGYIKGTNQIDVMSDSSLDILKDNNDWNEPLED